MLSNMMSAFVIIPCPSGDVVQRTMTLSNVMSPPVMMWNIDIDGRGCGAPWVATLSWDRDSGAPWVATLTCIFTLILLAASALRKPVHDVS